MQRLASFCIKLAVLVAVMLALGASSPAERAHAAASGVDLVVEVDAETPWGIGAFNSLQLDSDGNPVVSYRSQLDGLRVLHCDDPVCDGIGESITSPDPAGGGWTSLALDSSGNPVIAYTGSSELRLLHCDDPNCDGSGESITIPDTGKIDHVSLVLDASGNPVVSYAYGSDDDLRVLHCNDPNCDGGGESITTPDSAGLVGWWNSLALDSSGNPVIAYADRTNSDLKILHCDDPNCAGPGESITTPDAGRHTSLVLDSSGNPVVGYTDSADGRLKLLHCNDPLCDGTGESITSPDSSLAAFTSLKLDAGGNPVVVYKSQNPGGLTVLHCDDPNCDGVGESISTPRTTGSTETWNSLALDTNGNPVVSFYDSQNEELKLLVCDDPDCDFTPEGPPSVVDATGDVGLYTSMVLDGSGNPVVSYYDATNGDLKLLHCDDPNCAGAGDSITAPDTAGDVGQYTSLALDSSGNPVVSYYDVTNGDLKLLHCNDPNCAGGDESVTSPDTAGDVGQYTSLALDAAGNPIVAYLTDPGGKLGLLHCDDPNCDGTGESIVSFTNLGIGSSLVLDAAGNPVVASFEVTYLPFSPDLRLLHCNDTSCAGGDDIPFEIATGNAFAEQVALALDEAGNPVLGLKASCCGFASGLVIKHCSNPTCVGGSPFDMPDRAVFQGDPWPSLVLDGYGYPVVSYYRNRHNDSENNLKLLHCGDPNCAPGNAWVTFADTFGGLYSSLRLDAAGNPVISYYDEFNGDLRVLHCDDPRCIIDTDGDGCADALEIQSSINVSLGGGRDPKNPWDFYDVLGPGAALPKDGIIDLPNDILGVIQHFAPTGAAPYDVQFDRGPSAGLNPWNMTAPDGVIDLPNDILGVIMQFNHDCR